MFMIIILKSLHTEAILVDGGESSRGGASLVDGCESSKRMQIGKDLLTEASLVDGGASSRRRRV